ncbi:MAG TPA: hypothetical protein VMU26_02750 [Candidatus Polarisedimenticolia bacterium]|nr:hypothetical protein [Candidatus Polarisedimenticolia bacterium]
MTRNSLTNAAQGYAKLDPSLRTTKLITAWRLWVPEAWKVSAS